MENGEGGGVSKGSPDEGDATANYKLVKQKRYKKNKGLFLSKKRHTTKSSPKHD